MASPLSEAAAPLVELELETAGFAADWGHCDLAANYLAQLVSHDRPDSFLYANLLSTVLNELLETVFVRQARRGTVRCSLQRRAAVDVLELRVPVETADRDFYERSVAEAQAAGVAEAYARALLAGEAPKTSLGLLELAADYGARISLEEPAAAGEIRLQVEIRLDDGGLPALATGTL